MKDNIIIENSESMREITEKVGFTHEGNLYCLNNISVDYEFGNDEMFIGSAKFFQNF